MRQSHKAAFFWEKFHEINMKILGFNFSGEFSEEGIKSSNISEATKKTLLDLLQERESLKKAAEWAEGIEKALSMPKPISRGVQFLSEKEVNFLLSRCL